jgi:hypothetical protein
LYFHPFLHFQRLSPPTLCWGVGLWALLDLLAPLAPPPYTSLWGATGGFLAYFGYSFPSGILSSFTFYSHISFIYLFHFTNVICLLGCGNRGSGPDLFSVYMPWLPPPTRPMTHTKTFTFGHKKERFKTFGQNPIFYTFVHTHNSD